MQIQGTIALITGGGSGLGAATANRLAKAGARVGIFDLDAAKAEDMAKRIGGFALIGDVASPEDAEKALARCKEEGGAPRILVNCAGIAVAKRVVGREGPMPLSDFERIIRVNLVGSFNMLRVFAGAMCELAPMAEGERGIVISTASVAAYEGQIGQSAYSASKGGIVAMTLPIAREFAQWGIRVNTIAPGLFLTPLLESLPEASRASLGASIPFPPRLGQPDEFAALVEHMISNPFLNGEVVRLDGALRMAPK